MSLPATMTAAVLRAPKDLRVEDRPVPTPGPGDVLVRVSSVGICGSDLHFYQDGRSGSAVVDGPFVMGHEFSGTIAAVGRGVDRAIGERVSVEPGIQCGHCDECERDRYNHCTAMRFLGAAPFDGALQEYLLVPADHAFVVPDSVSDDSAALLEPLSVAIWAAARSGLRQGDSVAVVGGGPIGVLCALVARAHHAADIVVIEPNAGRRARAAEITGAEVLAPEQLADTEVIADIVFECSGTEPGLQTAVDTSRPGSTVVVVGVGLERLNIAMNILQEGEILITGSHRYRHTWPTAIQLVASGAINVDQLITHRFDINDTATAINAAKTGPEALKVIVRVSDSSLTRLRPTQP